LQRKITKTIIIIALSHFVCSTGSIAVYMLCSTLQNQNFISSYTYDLAIKASTILSLADLIHTVVLFSIKIPEIHDTIWKKQKVSPINHTNDG
jgi:hypothetical protein